MYKKTSDPIYRKTQIYNKPLSGKPESVVTSIPKRETHSVGRDDSTPLSAKYRVEINVTHPELNIGNGDVRVAAWVANDKPYKLANTLVNYTTDHNGVVVMEHSCKRGTEILIRARATDLYIGPTRDVLYVSPGTSDKIEIGMVNGRGI